MMKNALEKIREISNTKKINKWLIVVIVILLFGLIGASRSSETDKKTAQQKWDAMAAQASAEASEASREASREASKASKETSKEASKAEEAEKKKKSECMVLFQSAINEYINGAKYSRESDDYMFIEKDGKILIESNIGIENIPEKQSAAVIVTLLDDEHYRTHYVSVGNKVYLNDGTIK